MSEITSADCVLSKSRRQKRIEDVTIYVNNGEYRSTMYICPYYRGKCVSPPFNCLLRTLLRSYQWTRQRNMLPSD